MITKEQIENLKPGDKLIFYRNGSVLSTKKGNVYTFANWHNSAIPNSEYKFWQSKELLELGNLHHNFSIIDVELFDEKIHTDYKLMNKEQLDIEHTEFIKKYGA